MFSLEIPLNCVIYAEIVLGLSYFPQNTVTYLPFVISFSLQSLEIKLMLQRGGHHSSTCLSVRVSDRGYDIEIIALQNSKEFVSLQDMMTVFCLWWVACFNYRREYIEHLYLLNLQEVIFSFLKLYMYF